MVISEKKRKKVQSVLVVPMRAPVEKAIVAVIITNKMKETSVQMNGGPFFAEFVGFCVIFGQSSIARVQYSVVQ